MKRKIIACSLWLLGTLSPIHARLQPLYYLTNNYIKKSSLQSIEREIRDHKYAAREQVKEDFGISDATWQECLQNIEKSKQFLLRHNYAAPRAGYHDPNVPQSLRNMTAHALQKHGINPQSISLITELQNHSAAHFGGSTILAQATNPTIGYTYNMHGNTMINKKLFIDEPASISFNLHAVQSMPHNHQECIVHHEVTHIVEGHGVEESYIRKTLNNAGYTDRQINSHPTWLAYSRAIETEANVLPALKDKDMATKIYAHFTQQCNNNIRAMSKHLGTHPSPQSQLQILSKIIQAI